MQVEQRHACASCGSENASDADFCWRCLDPFPKVPPTPGVGRGLPPAPATWSPPAPAPPRPARSSTLVGAVVSIVAAVAAYVGVQYLMGPSVSLPDRLAGAERLDDQESRRFERYMDDEGERYGIEVDAGVYGRGLGPGFFVILVDASTVETTDQLFDALVLGFSQAGAIVDRSDAISGSRLGSDYRCVEASAGGGTAVACMWRDDDNVGIVLEMLGDPRGTRRLLWTVHDTVVG
jgi:hypothetical protein